MYILLFKGKPRGELFGVLGKKGRRKARSQGNQDSLDLHLTRLFKKEGLEKKISILAKIYYEVVAWHFKNNNTSGQSLHGFMKGKS